MHRNIIRFLLVVLILFFTVTAFAQQKDNAASEPPANTNANKASGTEQSVSDPAKKRAEKQKTIQMTDIHDIRPPEIIGVDLTILYLVLLTLFVAGLVVAAYLYFKKRRKKIKEKEIVKLSPDEAALALLDELMDMENSDGKEFYFQLSAILRNYIQGRYNINAPEMTTEEFLPKIEELGLQKELQKSLRELLRSIDPVKFAGSLAVQNKMKDDLKFVINFVNQTKKQLIIDN
ncbi:DUF4381 family protein [Desulfonema magnum]|nr:DUF4381 family protein [Desulfonema magnum]